MHALFSKFIKLIGLLVLITSCQCSSSRLQKQVWIRGIQLTNSTQESDVLRVYMDKFGYFYPNLSVPMDQVAFFDDQDGKLAVTDTTIANLYHYFSVRKADMSRLKSTYQVKDQPSFHRDFYKVQEKILDEYKGQLKALVDKNGSGNIVYIVHGFNDENPISSYQLLEQNILSNPYGKNAKPVFVEIYWDGLTSSGKNAMLAKIWGRAQNNTKYVSLGLRTLLNHLSLKLPVTLITHSLGASVGTGALFNTTSKWKLYEEKELNDEFTRLLQAPTRGDVRIRLGMLAPAIPGGNTFVDFNKRSPDIIASRNNIDKLVIGYNPKDYATSKAVLSRHLGTTTLGCNQGSSDPEKGEIPRVRERLFELGYSRVQISQMVKPVLFTTAKYKVGLQEHGLSFYLGDKESTDQFIRLLFE